MARLDAYLKKMAGGDNATPAPQNDLDKSLNTLAAGGGGGGDVFMVNIIQDSETTEYSVDKTYAEIMAAYGAGKICLFNINNVSLAYGTFVPPDIMPNAPIYVSVFVYMHTAQADALQAGTYIIASDNSVTSNANYFSLTPMGG